MEIFGSEIKNRKSMLLHLWHKIIVQKHLKGSRVELSSSQGSWYPPRVGVTLGRELFDGSLKPQLKEGGCLWGQLFSKLFFSAFPSVFLRVATFCQGRHSGSATSRSFNDSLGQDFDAVRMGGLLSSKKANQFCSLSGHCWGYSVELD